jgi:uncharacterized protein YecT (DUF1311 family)
MKLRYLGCNLIPISRSRNVLSLDNMVLSLFFFSGRDRVTHDEPGSSPGKPDPTPLLSTMKAIRVYGRSGPGQLRYENAPLPRLLPGDTPRFKTGGYMANLLRLVMTLVIFSVLAGAQQNVKHGAEIPPMKSACDGASTQIEMNDCAAKEQGKADADLNAVYQKLEGLLERDLAAAQERNDEQQKVYVQSAQQKLAAAEKAWAEYRDLHCEAAGQQYEGGSIRPMVEANCRELVAKHRIEELKSAYETPDRTLD